MQAYDLQLKADLEHFRQHARIHILRLLNQAHPSKKMLQKYPYLPQLKTRIIDATPLLSDTAFEYTLITRIYWILNDIRMFPCCQICGAPIVHFNLPDLTSVYRSTCSDDCERLLASKTCVQTMKDSYGIENAFQLPKVIQATKDLAFEREQQKKRTKLKHYGDPNFNNTIQANRRKLEKYGNVWNLRKCRETWLKELGVDNPMKSEECQLKSQQKKLEKYGDPFFNNPSQRIETMIKNGIPFHRPTRRYRYHDLKFDSSWELAFYIYLTDMKKEFAYPCPQVFEYIGWDDKLHHYHPDFLVEGQIIEIKGDQFLDPVHGLINPFGGKEVIKDGYHPKFQCMLDHDVLVMSNAQMEPILRYVDEVYGQNYLEQFHNRPEHETV